MIRLWKYQSLGWWMLPGCQLFLQRSLVWSSALFCSSAYPQRLNALIPRSHQRVWPLLLLLLPSKNTNYDQKRRRKNQGEWKPAGTEVVPGPTDQLCTHTDQWFSPNPLQTWFNWKERMNHWWWRWPWRRWWRWWKTDHLWSTSNSMSLRAQARLESIQQSSSVLFISMIRRTIWDNSQNQSQN